MKYRRIVLLETDGALLLSLGALASGNVAPPNLRAFVFDNEGYERVRHNISATKGKTDLAKVAAACGIPQATTVGTVDAFAEAASAAMEG